MTRHAAKGNLYRRSPRHYESNWQETEDDHYTAAPTTSHNHESLRESRFSTSPARVGAFAKSGLRERESRERQEVADEEEEEKDEEAPELVPGSAPQPPEHVFCASAFPVDEDREQELLKSSRENPCIGKRTGAAGSTRTTV